MAFFQPPGRKAETVHLLLYACLEVYMRKKQKKLSKILLSFLLCLSLILPITQTLFSTPTSGMGMGTLVFNERREIARGVFLDTWQGRADSGKPKRGYSLTFHPGNSDGMVVASYGDSVNSRKTLSRMIAAAESKGYFVIGGINGDFYQLSNGVPIGIVMREGRLISNNSDGTGAIGFKADGSAVIGKPNVEIKALIGEGRYPISHLNKAQGDWGPYLYTSDFGPTTGSTEPSIEVVIDIKSGDVKLGGKVDGVVSAVYSNTKATPIGKNQMILSARNGKYGAPFINALFTGIPISFSFNIADPAWNGVQEAIGGSNILISKGQMNPALSATNFNPTTAVGIKGNGEVVFLEVDGRNDAHSMGMSSMDAARFLMEQGCVDALQMDGGGSSTISARLPGNGSPSVLNKPSDGTERANANGLLILSRQGVRINRGEAPLTLDASLLHLYPGKTFALPGAAVSFRAAATNSDYFPVTLPQNLIWTADSGTIDATGKMTASSQPGTYRVYASNGMASGNATLVVVNPADITAVIPSKTSFSILPGTSQSLTAQARYNDIPIPSVNNQYLWQVEGTIGTITPEGVFTAAAGGDASGRIKVSMGNAFAYIDVTLGQQPDVVDSFESSSGWTHSLIRAASGKAAIVESTDAMFGSKMLRIDYDFTLSNGVAQGTAGIYALKSVNGVNGIPLEGNPTAIGMWVYGDNKKAWLRAKVTDSTGASFDIDFTPDYRPDTKAGGINWTGWKYVEAQIPAGKKGPFILDTPVRIMCTRDEMRTSGSIYVDNIRALYGAKSDDMKAPEATVSQPADQAVLKSGKVPFAAQITDNIALDDKSVKLFVDGVLVKDAQVAASNGALNVTAEVGAASPLADGYHTLVLQFADAFGNKGSKTVTFTVDTGAPQIKVQAPASVLPGETVTYIASVKNPNTLKKLYMVINYDPTALEAVDADAKTKGIQTGLEAWVKAGKVINNRVDAENGRIYIEVDNLKAASKQDLIKTFQVTFKAKTTVKPTGDISLSMGAMIFGQNKSGSLFGLPAAKVGIGYGLNLSVSGTSPGEKLTITVTDKAGKPVPDAGIYYNGMTDFILLTDSSGKVVTDVFDTLPAGSVITLQAKKDGLVSSIVSFKMGEAPAALVPQALHLSYDGSGGIRFHYLTAAGQPGTTLQIMEKSAYTGSFTESAFTLEGTSAESTVLNVDKTEKVTVHSAVVAGLKPGVAYVYRLKDAAGRISAVYECIVPNTAAPYSFLFLTDPQATNAATYAVYKDTLEKAWASAGNPAFAVLTGDMVDRGHQKNQWDLFFQSSSGVFPKIPVMMVPGNHEYYDDANLANYKTYLGMPENGSSGLGETSYSFETEDALFMTLDTQKPLAAQLQWLEQKAAASVKKWKVVMMHRGIYAGFYNESELRKAIAPVFDKAGIDLVLSGHDHTYLRTTMKAGTKVKPGAGTTYITGGSSAKKYYDAEKRTWTEVLFDTNLPVFTVLKVQSDRITVISSHVENGKAVEHDRFDILK